MLPDRVSTPGPLTYESGALPTALRGPALVAGAFVDRKYCVFLGQVAKKSRQSRFYQFIRVFEQLCKVVGELCFATDLLVG